MTHSSKLRISVIGIGYLGLTHAACMADLGHQVLATDIDHSKISKAVKGEVPFFEPGLEPLLRKNIDRWRLQFTASYKEIAESADVHFLCVGTPQSEDGSSDLSYLDAAVDALAPYLSRACLVVGKSTVPVGTARKVAARLEMIAPAGADVELAWNPEFLREGFAVQDSLAPDRLVFGAESDRAANLLREVYATPLSAGIPGLAMDLETAELVKVSANAFLATKVSFINAVAQICERVGADVTRLAEALRYDERIGRRYLSPGLGFGGGCLPKDVRAFQATATDLNAMSLVTLLSSVVAINAERRIRVVEMARRAVGGCLDGRKITVLGMSFKPDTDDIRDSPSLAVCESLLQEGATVAAHDPAAVPLAALTAAGLQHETSIFGAAEAADLVLHMTEGNEYRAIDPAALAVTVSQLNMIDARCTLDGEFWRSADWSFEVLGQPRMPRTSSQRAVDLYRGSSC